MHPTNNRIITLKSLKYKNFAKGCHRSASSNQKTSQTFFDSSYYQYLRQNHGLVNLEQSPNQSNLPRLQPHPVIGANTNFNTLDDVLNDDYLNHYNNQNQNHHIISSPSNNITNYHLSDYNNYASNHHYNNETIINQTLSKKYYSTITNPTNATNNLNQDISNIQNNKNGNNNESLERNHINQPLESDLNIWEDDTEESLNPSTYLKTHLDQINQCYETKQYSRINALYQSLRRNNIVVPLEIYEKILDSFDKRSFDINNKNLDEKMFSLLNCYHDLINSKLKPTTKIYNCILSQIFKNSIVAFESNNQNGLDFFKIGSELFHTVLKNNALSKDVVNYYLLALNLFSGSPFKYFNKQNQSTVLIPNLEFFKSTIIDSSAIYEKDSFYFISLINLAKLKNDLNLLKKLYQEFLLLLPLESSQSVRDHQFEIYSIFISSFLETGEVTLSNKIFENLINEIKLKDGMTENIQLILSNYLISLSKLDAQKAYSLWLSFKKLRWVPEFSYDFYLQLMSNSFHDWELTKKIYAYIFPMQRIFSNKSKSMNSLRTSHLSNYLLYPIHTEMILNSLLNYALQLNDQEVVFKLLEESVIKSFNFDINLYPFIFKFLVSAKCSSVYLLRMIESHGNLLADENITKNDKDDNLLFLNAITDATKDSAILQPLIDMKCFETICKNLEFNSDKSQDQAFKYNGLITILEALWNAPKTADSYPIYLEIQAILISRIFDFDTYVSTEENNLNENTKFSKFKKDLMTGFEKMATNFKRLNLDPNSVKPFVSQAVKLSNLSEEYIEYFNHPGDWDKSYPLSLGSQIRNAPTTGIKDFEKLSNQDYCFDYDTYKELIKNKYINKSIIEKGYSFVNINDTNELKYLSNLIISKIAPKDIEQTLFLAPNNQIQTLSFEKQFFFQKFILNYLRDKSLSKILRNLNHVKLSPQFISTLRFPENFKSITIQAEFKESIDIIYEKLFEAKNFESILKFNEQCPVINLNILLKSAIRAGANEDFESLLQRFKSSLTKEQSTEIKYEYLIDNLKIDEAIQLYEQNKSNDNSTKVGDYYTFALFLKSFTSHSLDLQILPQNTLQFANQLSTFSSFTEILTFYNVNSKILGISSTNMQTREVNQHILDQMLQNLVDASHLLFDGRVSDSQLDRTEIIKKFQLKLKTFSRFKAFLKSQQYKTSDLLNLIDVWTTVEPFSIDILFNNIIETIYLKPNLSSSILTLKNGLVWNFDSLSLQIIANDFIKAYESLGETNKIDKVQQFKTFLSKQPQQVILKQ